MTDMQKIFEQIQAAEEAQNMIVSEAIYKCNLKDNDTFIECFLKIQGSKITQMTAYFKMEEIYKQKYGNNKYANFETFKTILYRWQKKQKS